MPRRERTARRRGLPVPGLAAALCAHAAGAVAFFALDGVLLRALLLCLLRLEALADALRRWTSPPAGTGAQAGPAPAVPGQLAPHDAPGAGDAPGAAEVLDEALLEEMSRLGAAFDGVVRTCLATTPARLDELVAAVASTDSALVGRLAHVLAGSARALRTRLRLDDRSPLHAAPAG